MIPPSPRTRIKEYLALLYGQKTAEEIAPRLWELMDSFRKRPARRLPWPAGRQDAFLITYGDQFKSPGEPPLRTLAKFAGDYLKDIVPGIHILPFFPSTSDDGFSVSDYTGVDPALGTWEDIEDIAGQFCLMVDAVINHCSIEHPWFQEYLKGNPQYQGYFIEVPPEIDLSMVVRPRALPLLTRFRTATGEKYLWTTFSADQVDLNYKNPQVLLDILAVLLEYAAHGAQLIRLDAIAYLWKEIGSPCIHLPQTHWIIRLMRAVFDEVLPSLRLITETNVPHRDNISYFGDGANEARLVYNFALPPLMLHSIQKQDTRVLTAWAAGLRLPSGSVTFFNFLASHDGIGLNPARGILEEQDVEDLAGMAVRLGGQVSYKNNPDGSQSPYELNINFFDALGDPHGLLTPQQHILRFMAAQAVMLAMQGVPGIYVHSLLGSHGWPAGAALTGQKRTINRQKFQAAEVRAELADPRSLRSQVYRSYCDLLKVRIAAPAFHPAGSVQVLDVGSQTFCLTRTSPDGKDTVICIHNLTPLTVSVDLPAALYPAGARLCDIISLRTIIPSENHRLECNPYQVLWLAVEEI